jgi:hypothetical protein
MGVVVLGKIASERWKSARLDWRTRPKQIVTKSVTTGFTFLFLSQKYRCIIKCFRGYLPPLSIRPAHSQPLVLHLSVLRSV